MPITQYAFFVNSDACSGCKTCQVACKDKYDLPAGIHWRRVYEVTAGGWQEKEGVWASTVVAYNLSVACHHCLNPLCAFACPTQAIWKTERRHGVDRREPLHEVPSMQLGLPVRRDLLQPGPERHDQVRFLPGLAGRGPAAGLRGGLPEPRAGFRGFRGIEKTARRCEPGFSAAGVLDRPSRPRHHPAPQHRSGREPRPGDRERRRGLITGRPRMPPENRCQRTQQHETQETVS